MREGRDLDVRARVCPGMMEGEALQEESSLSTSKVNLPAVQDGQTKEQMTMEEQPGQNRPDS